MLKSTPEDVIARVVALRARAGVPRGLAVVELHVRRGEMTPLHVHDEDETIRVLEGRLVVHTDDGTRTLLPGEALMLSAAVPHAVAAGEAGAHYLTMSNVRSAEHYERFVRAAAVPERAGTSDPPTVEEERALAFVAEANGITVLGPPGALAGLAAA